MSASQQIRRGVTPSGVVAAGADYLQPTSAATTNRTNNPNGRPSTWREAELRMALHLRAQGHSLAAIGQRVGKTAKGVEFTFRAVRQGRIPLPAGCEVPRMGRVNAWEEEKRQEAAPRPEPTWTDEEMTRAVEMRADRWTDASIAGALGRSAADVRFMLASLRRDKPGCTPIRRDAPWRQHIDTIRDLAANGYPDSAIADRLGGCITSEMVRHARRQAGIPAGVPRNGWAPRRQVKDSQTLRVCLGRGCMDKPRERRLFASDGPGHRICDGCAKLVEHAA